MGYRGYKTFSETCSEWVNLLIDNYNHPNKYQPDEYDGWICVCGYNAVDEICQFHINDLLVSRFEEHLKYDEFRRAMLTDRHQKHLQSGKKGPAPSYEWEFIYEVEDHPKKFRFRMKEIFTCCDGATFHVRSEDFPKFIEFLGHEFGQGFNSETIENVESILDSTSRAEFHSLFYGK